MEYLIIVDENGDIIGEIEKEKCHQKNGILHLGFLIMVSNREAKLMLARRSYQKKLWPNFWDGTVAGHFHQGENYDEAARKKIFQEIGVKCFEIEFFLKFRYQYLYKNIGSENEICYVYLAKNINDRGIFLNKNEATEYRFYTIQTLKKQIDSYPHKFTPWFLVAFKKFFDNYY